MEEVVELNTSIYSISDMKAGLDIAMLEARASLLTQFVRLDPRGGVFKHISMECALTAALQAAGQQEAFAKASAEGEAFKEFTGPTTMKDFVALVAYKTRVMLAHLRDQFDRGNAVSDGLLDVFALMTTQKKTSGRSRHRSQRLARENPFIHFRTSPSPSPSSMADEEEPTVITKFYDPKAKQATMLLSDGSVQSADEYLRGERGFIQAAWFCPKDSLELTVPNPFLVDGVIIDKVKGDDGKDASSGNVKKRPAAPEAPAAIACPKRKKMRAAASEPEEELDVGMDGQADEAAEEGQSNMDLDEEGEEAGDDDEEEEECGEKDEGEWKDEEEANFPVFMVVPSHKGSAIQVKNPHDPKDKVQVMNITERHCLLNDLKEKGASKQICLDIKEELMKMKVMHSEVEYPLKGNAVYLPLLKSCAWYLKKAWLPEGLGKKAKMAGIKDN